MTEPISYPLRFIEMEGSKCVASAIVRRWPLIPHVGDLVFLDGHGQYTVTAISHYDDVAGSLKPGNQSPMSVETRVFLQKATGENT